MGGPSPANARPNPEVAGPAFRSPAAEAAVDVGPGLQPHLDKALLLECQIWSLDANLPDYGEGPARLMLREFERYCTDRTVPERRGNTTHCRRLIFYATILDL